MRFHQLEFLLQSIRMESLKDFQVAEISTMLHLLRESQKFYAGNVDALPEIPRHIDIEFFPKLPYKTTSIELETYRFGKNDAPIRSIVIAHEESDGNILFYPFYMDLSCMREWTISGAIGRANRSDCQLEYMLSSLISDENGNLRASEEITLQHESAIDPEEFGNFSMRLCVIASNFLNVLNCVNVRTEEVLAPAALNKKRIKSGKPPIYSYKQLVLRPTPAARAHGGGTHDSPRIHLRRGHIKHRKTGDFWWQPHVVGDRSRGIVMKDYRADQLMKA